MALQKPQKRKSYGAGRRRGFTAMSGLIEGKVKAAGERRGFAAMRLLTHWAEIVGPDIARVATPVKIGYARDGFGGVLTILVSGSHAPMVQMQLPEIRDRVNACYGYMAVSRVTITQTAPVGFQEAQTPFDAETTKPRAPVSQGVKRASAELAGDIENEGLRSAIERLAQNVLTRQGAPEGDI